MAEFRGPERDVGADLTVEASAAFKAAIVKLFAQDLQGDLGIPWTDRVAVGSISDCCKLFIKSAQS